MRRKPGRPTLVALDFRNMTARRYWPKPGDQKPATFLTHVGELRKPDDEPWKMGEQSGLDLLEQFREGKLAPITDEDMARTGGSVSTFIDCAFLIVTVCCFIMLAVKLIGVFLI